MLGDLCEYSMGGGLLPSLTGDTGGVIREAVEGLKAVERLLAARGLVVMQTKEVQGSATLRAALHAALRDVLAKSYARLMKRRQETGGAPPLRLSANGKQWDQQSIARPPPSPTSLCDRMKHAAGDVLLNLRCLVKCAEEVETCVGAEDIAIALRGAVAAGKALVKDRLRPAIVALEETLTESPVEEGPLLRFLPRYMEYTRAAAARERRIYADVVSALRQRSCRDESEDGSMVAAHRELTSSCKAIG
jgi:hypothetical protein